MKVQKPFLGLCLGKCKEKSIFRVFLGTSAGQKHRSSFFVLLGFFFEWTEAQKIRFLAFLAFYWGTETQKSVFFFVFRFFFLKKPFLGPKFGVVRPNSWNFSRLHRLRTRPGRLPDASRTPPGCLPDASRTPPGHFCPKTSKHAILPKTSQICHLRLKMSETCQVSSALL